MVSGALADTIVAVATAQGRGAIGVVRVSGPLTRRVMQRVCGRELTPRAATRLSFRDQNGEPIDDGLAIFFSAPHSYTGEDVLELQGHGGPAVLGMVVQACLIKDGQDGQDGQDGSTAHAPSQIRLANPGEFTQRAFLNDKLDLAQAEAVSDLIQAGSERAVRSALASLQGRFSERVHGLLAQLIDLRMRVEACLDFPEEDIEFIGREDVAGKLARAAAGLEEVLQSAGRGAALKEGLRVALVGPPNVGKSSLLNALAEQDVALVTQVAGTTRDRIVQEIFLEGVPIHVTDTAGLRDTADEVEKLGIQRTWQEIGRAELILVLRDATGAITADEQTEKAITDCAKDAARVLVVFNKADLVSEAARDLAAIYVSAKTGEGLFELKRLLLHHAGWAGDASEGVFSARARQLDALKRAYAHLQSAASHLRSEELELLAECLKLSQGALSEVTGEFSSDDLLGEIFGRFCIGK